MNRQTQSNQDRKSRKNLLSNRHKIDDLEKREGCGGKKKRAGGKKKVSYISKEISPTRRSPTRTLKVGEKRWQSLCVAKISCNRKESLRE